MADTLPATESREIRVFLSSTFRDFMQERDLLVQRVFPSLRRRAQERGVEVVDVDLRWGITEAESQQGKVIGICLAEIERCRPYFIGMLGERYGWTPKKGDYPPVLLQREQLQWLREYQGGASVTELEILHGVLNDKKMAGRAFFYFRDPAWSRAQSEPGFVCDTAGEEAKLTALKDRILASGFPVAEDLPDPKAIADQIEADLWALIEEQYPDLDQADALEREARKHASYRQSRVGVYLGQEHVDQLKALVSSGQQKILIAGESGSGKSALIANWIHQHEREHPGDVVYAHHLGCSNDASAIRPLLGRLLDTASKLLKETNLITEPIQVPQDWWELTAKVAETLQDLGRWCRTTGHRWIWVLDGLDRLAGKDQQALPWLPLLIPEGVSVVISALDCPARAIVQERQFRLLEIGPLQRAEQEQLIETYLERYTKKLDADRVEQILASPLARSPLFLRVLLEELRQCGRFETLEAQIAGYIRPNADGSLAVNDLYARVLARLEVDYGVEPVRKALTALWASRAGLSEPELLAITDLKPLQWAPIDLGLAQALGRNGNRLVFDHDYLRQAVESRYLLTEEMRCEAHSLLADWYDNQREWDARKSEEMPWQLLRSERYSDLIKEIVQPRGLIAILKYRDEAEYGFLFRRCGADAETLAQTVRLLVSSRETGLTATVLDSVSALLESLTPGSSILLETRFSWVEACSAEYKPVNDMHRARRCLANSLKDSGRTVEAIEMYRQLIEAAKDQPIPNEKHACALEGMAAAFGAANDYEQAELLFRESISERILLFGRSHPTTITAFNNLAVTVLSNNGRNDEALEILEQNYQEEIYLYGAESLRCAITAGNLSMAYYYAKNDPKAVALARASISSLDNLLPAWSDISLKAVNNLSVALFSLGNVADALELLHGSLMHAGHDRNPEIIAALCQNIWDNYRPEFLSYNRIKELYMQCLEECTNCKRTQPALRQRAYLELATLAHVTGHKLTAEDAYLGLIRLCTDISEESQCEALYVYARYLSEESRLVESIDARRRELLIRRRFYGDADLDVLSSLNELAIDLRRNKQLEEAEAIFRDLLEACQRVLEPSDFDVGRAMGGLAITLEEGGKLEEAAAFALQALDHRLAHEGPDAWWTNRKRLDLARVLHKLGRSAEALCLLDQLEMSMKEIGEPDESDTELLEEAEALRVDFESSKS